jgi:hypothetical protein
MELRRSSESAAPTTSCHRQGKTHLAFLGAHIRNPGKVFYLALALWLGKAEIMTPPVHAHNSPTHLGDED